MITLMIVLVILALIAGPTWPHSRTWGYYPSGGLGLSVHTEVLKQEGRRPGTAVMPLAGLW